MLLVDYARDELGMPMRGLQFGTHIGWTTDGRKRDLLVAAGANSTTVTWAGRTIGYEVTIPVGREVVEAQAA